MPRPVDSKCRSALAALVLACTAAAQPRTLDAPELDRQRAERIRQAGIARTIARLGHSALEVEVEAVDVRAVELAPDGATLLIAEPHRMRWFDLAGDGSGTWEHESADVVSASLAPGRRIVAVFRNRAVIFDDTFEVEAAIQAEPGWSFDTAARAAGDGLVVFGGHAAIPGPGGLEIWSMTTVDRVVRISLGEPWGIRGALSRDGTAAALLTGSGYIQVCDARSGAPLAKLFADHHAPNADGSRGVRGARCLLFDRDGRRLYVGDRSGDVRARDLDDAQHDARRWHASDAPIDHLALGPVAATLLTTDAAGHQHLWDVGGDVVREIPMTPPRPGRLLFADDGERFAVVGSDTVTVWR